MHQKAGLVIKAGILFPSSGHYVPNWYVLLNMSNFLYQYFVPPKL
jgi:hypothetical protein